MQLRKVTGLDGSRVDLGNLIDHMQSVNYLSEKDLYRSFRDAIPNGRYSLWIESEGKAFIVDTNMLEKGVLIPTTSA